MTRDFEDMNDLDDLSDDELRGLIREHLAGNDSLGMDEVNVEAHNGAVVLSGRVGTDAERLIAEHIVTDLVGAPNVQNDIFVDPSRRATAPEDTDDTVIDGDRRAEQMLDREVPLSAESDSAEEEIEAQLYGTTDVTSAIEDGTPWIPPDSATPEGLTGPGEAGEQH
jgi:hypothetical protein